MQYTMVKSAKSTARSSQRIAKRLKQSPDGDNEGVQANSVVVSVRNTSSSSSILLSLPVETSQSPLEDNNLLEMILLYVGEFQYRFIGGVNRIFHETYVSLFPEKETKCNASSISMTKFCWKEIISQKATDIDKCIELRDLWYSVIQYGKLAVVKYYREALEVLLSSPEQNESYYEMFCKYDYMEGLDYRAAKYGHLDLLQWACQENKGVVKGSCRTCVDALGNGHLALFDWAVENGFDWDPDEDWEQVAYIAASNGKLEVLQWLEGKKYDVSEIEECQYEIFGLCTSAAEEGHMEVLKWLHEHGCPWYEYTICIAIKNGHTEVVKYMVENGCELTDKSCHIAAIGGNVATLQFLRSINCEWDHLVPAFAAAHGNVDLIEWAVNNGCPWSESACEYAATYGELETLKWLRKKGCPWDENTTKYKHWDYKYTNDEIYHWAVDNGCPVYQGNRGWVMEYDKSMNELLRIFDTTRL